jgi:Predicted membrane protein
MKKENLFDWFFRLVKGLFIGLGVILPGVSGGALAAVFGIYERMISFLSNIFKDFWQNVFFFIPVGIGAVFSVFILSHPLDYFLKNNKVQVLWCFIGCIIGTLPALWREAGKEGRKKTHVMITIITAILACVALMLAKTYMNVEVAQNTFTWMMAGAIFAFGFIIPGLSPSNFLMYMNMYEAMNEGIKNLDLSILIPVAIGGIACVIVFAKLIGYILKRAYAPIFHFIFGVVIASTVIIMPAFADYQGIGVKGYVATALLFIGGIGVGCSMELLDKKFKSAKVA